METIAEVYSKEQLIAAIKLLEVNKPVSVLLHHSDGLTVFRFAYTSNLVELQCGRKITLDDRIQNIIKQIKKLPRHLFRVRPKQKTLSI